LRNNITADGRNVIVWSLAITALNAILAPVALTAGLSFWLCGESSQKYVGYTV